MFYENAINQIEKLSKIIMTELNLKNQSNPLSIKLHRIKTLQVAMQNALPRMKTSY